MSNAEQLMVEVKSPDEPSPSIPRHSIVDQAMQAARQPPRPGPLYDVTKMVRDFWPSQIRRIEHMSENEMREHCKHMELPMARVKKVMRLDDEVRAQMISSDAPLLLAAASEMFIQEITLRAWQLVEEGRRKTLQKSDIAAAASRFEHFDFLIDIVPREDAKKSHDEMHTMNVTSDGTIGSATQVQYVLAGDAAQGNDVYHLDNGQVLHATPIGQPIPIGAPSSGNIDISQLPPGMQIVHLPTQ
ncbi:unnamed protein product [Cylicocyclus nassatus]|uniref:Transcription factor CBF/NF-Y/archaeal histone domain-containing protein n=1 Tax=Cylicocyclus nassatus TaxID=53992 RepID=A0AA36M2K0_CYLNA|nr:unnamed protein product [Cylicocyclus nassatus]